MSQGWFCFHRKHLSEPIGSSLELVGAWAIYQSQASHIDRDIFIGFEKVHLKPGQFVWGERSWGEKYNVSPAKARRLLKLVEREELIKCFPTSRFTLVEVVNWKKLQMKKPKSEEQKKSKRRAKKERKKTKNNVGQFIEIKLAEDFKNFSKYLKNLGDLLAKNKISDFPYIEKTLDQIPRCKKEDIVEIVRKLEVVKHCIFGKNNSLAKVVFNEAAGLVNDSQQNKLSGW